MKISVLHGDERGEPFYAKAIKELFQAGMESQTTLLARFDAMTEELEAHIGIDMKANTLTGYHKQGSTYRGLFSIVTW